MPNLNGGAVYGFNAPLSAADQLRLLEECYDVAQAERLAQGFPALPPLIAGTSRLTPPAPAAPIAGGAGGGVPPPVPGAPAAPVRRGIAPAGGRWDVDEPTDVGDFVTLPAGTVPLHGRALIDIGGFSVCVRHVAAGQSIDDYASERKALLCDDTRILPVSHEQKTGIMSSVLDEMDNDKSLKFPIEGEWTADWIIDEHLKQDGGTFVQKVHRWCQVLGISKGDRVRHERLVIAKALDLGVLVDRMNLKNLAMVEHLLRRDQLIVSVYEENPSNPDWTASEHFMGTTEKPSGALVVPSLQKHVATRMGEQSAILKQKRKAREARKAVKRAGKDKDKEG